MAVTGTITAAQGTQTLSSSAYDQLTVTVSSGTYSVEYPIGTVIANGATATASYQLGAGACRITVNAGSVDYSLAQIDDNAQTQLTKTLTDAEFVILAEGSGLTTGMLYKVGTPEVWYRATSASQSTAVGSGAGSGVILSSSAQTASVLIKTGPAKAYSIVQTSGSGKPTLRDGVTVSGSLVSGWGGGGASGLTLTANTPYAPSTAPTDFANGIYLEINGTATVVVFYQ